jgi:hypothetical protein
MDAVPILIKPLIFPPCYSDESPIGYLKRITLLNGYRKYWWFFPENKELRKISEQGHLYNLLANNQWTGFSNTCPIVKEIFELPQYQELVTTLHYCPQCALENGYLRAIWQLKYSVACSIHKIWLEDRCSACWQHVPLTSCELNTCVCGKARDFSKGTFAPKAVLLWQAFLEGVLEVSLDQTTIRIERSTTLTLRQRIGIFSAVAWKAFSDSALKMKNFQISLNKTRALVEKTTLVLFGGRDYYWSFLQTLMPSSENEFGYGHQFSGFCSSFSRLCLGGQLSEFEKIHDEFVGTMWKKSLTNRNRNFSKGIREKHQWIAFQVACKKYGIDKSDMRRALHD